MRSLIGKGVLALLVCCFEAAAPAQTTIQPGQIDSDSAVAIPTTNVASVSSSSMFPSNSSIAVVPAKPGRFVNGLWIVSMFAAAGASALDADTSWGKKEGNPLLASSNGTFGAKGLSIKAGIASAILVPQILLRKHREMKGIFAAGNLGDAAIFSGVAVHNMGLHTVATH